MSTHDSTLARLRRSRLAAIAVGMIAVLGAALVATAPPATSDGPTVFSNPNDINIPAGAPGSSIGPAGPYPSINQVSGMNGVITNVRVFLDNIDHTFPDDMDVLLVSPAGKKVMLMSDVGSNGTLVDVDLVFRDDAAGTILDAPTITSGSYLPTDANPGETLPVPAPAGPYSTTLSTFNGDVARGDWKLFVSDDASGDVGEIDRWRLRIVTAVGNQTVTITSSSADAPVGTTRQAAATGGGSGNPIVFSEGPSTTNDACDVSGTGLITFKHVGVCDVHADQAGNADYNAGTATHQLINVVKGSPVIMFTTPNPSPVSIGQVYDANATSNFTVNPVTFSVGGLTTNNACTVNNITGVTTFNNNGVCEVAANQAGNEDWHPATQVSQIIQVQKTAQSITFTSVPPANPAIGSTYQATATGGGSGNPVTFTSNTPAVCSVTSSGLVTFLAVGNCSIQANQAGNANYSAAPPVNQSINNVKNGQTIDTSGMPTGGFEGWTVQMNASGGGGSQPVTYASTTPAVCTTTTGGLVTYVNGGTCTLLINQAGDANYHAAPQVVWNINVYGY